MTLDLERNNIFRLRFDHSKKPAEEIEFSCRDFRKEVYRNVFYFNRKGEEIEPDTERLDEVIRFLKDCAAFAHTFAADTDICRKTDGFEVYLYFSVQYFGREILAALTALMQRSEHAIIAPQDMFASPPAATLCLIRLHVSQPKSEV